MRLLGFVLGLTLGGLGLLILVNPPLATRARDVLVQGVQGSSSPAPRATSPTPALAPPTPAEAHASSPLESPLDGAQLSEDRTVLADSEEDNVQVTSQRPSGDAVETSTPPSGASPAAASQDHASGEIGTNDEASAATMQPEPPAGPRHWYAIWSPFLTARAARGFADRLATLTGLEFTVIEIGPRRHQVAFAYLDNAQRDTALAIIEGETGLELEGTK